MTGRTVTTQAELDTALADAVDNITIDSPVGVWLTLAGTGSSHVVARESSHVVAWGSSHVVAWGSSHVEAWGSSSVVAWESSHVEARESSHVVAWGSSHVVAWGSSSVVAWESSHVEARESSHVEAGRYVAIHLHSQRVTLTGGVVIDLTAMDPTDRETWIDFHGITAQDGKAVVYKAVDAGLFAGHGYTLTKYPIGEDVTAADWLDNGRCGRGLHFGVSPSHARGYFNGEGTPRFLACEIDADAFTPLDDKVKAQSCRVLFEVDVHGDRVAA